MWFLGLNENELFTNNFYQKNLKMSVQIIDHTGSGGGINLCDSSCTEHLYVHVWVGKRAWGGLRREPTCNCCTRFFVFPLKA